MALSKSTSNQFLPFEISMMSPGDQAKDVLIVFILAFEQEHGGGIWTHLSSFWDLNNGSLVREVQLCANLSLYSAPNNISCSQY